MGVPVRGRPSSCSAGRIEARRDEYHGERSLDISSQYGLHSPLYCQKWEVLLANTLAPLDYWKIQTGRSVRCCRRAGSSTLPRWPRRRRGVVGRAVGRRGGDTAPHRHGRGRPRGCSGDRSDPCRRAWRRCAVARARHFRGPAHRHVGSRDRVVKAFHPVPASPWKSAGTGSTTAVLCGDDPAALRVVGGPGARHGGGVGRTGVVGAVPADGEAAGFVIGLLFGGVAWYPHSRDRGFGRPGPSRPGEGAGTRRARPGWGR